MVLVIPPVIILEKEFKENLIYLIYKCMKKKFKCKDWPSSLGNFRSMKFFVLFMLLAVFHVNAKVKSQETALSIKKTNAALIDILKSIEVVCIVTVMWRKW